MDRSHSPNEPPEFDVRITPPMGDDPPRLIVEFPSIDAYAAYQERVARRAGEPLLEAIAAKVLEGVGRDSLLDRRSEHFFGRTPSENDARVAHTPSMSSKRPHRSSRYMRTNGS